MIWYLYNIRRSTVTTDGGASLDWVESGKAYAYIKPRSGLENFVGMQIQDKITHDIRMRYRADLVPNNRLVLEEGETTRRFQIRAVINVGGKRSVCKDLCRGRSGVVMRVSYS